MLRQRTRTLQTFIALNDAAATVAAFFVTYYAVGKFPETWGMQTVLPITHYFWLPSISIPLWWILFALFGCYDQSPIERVRDSLKRLAWPLATGALAIGTMAFFSKEELFSRRIIGAFLAGNVSLIVLGRILILKSAPGFMKGAARRILVVGSGEASREFGEVIRQAGWGLELAGYVSGSDEAPGTATLGSLAELRGILDERAIDDVVLAEPGREPTLLAQVIRTCEEVGVPIHIAAGYFSLALSRPHLESFRGIPMLTFSPVPYGPISLGIKRSMDIALSVLLGALFAFPMLAIAIAIKLTSHGPIIFKQRRSGLYGREFVMLKFRSMHAEAEQRRAELESANEMTGPVFKMRDDPRITRVGRFLRRYSLDELPQLWNVFAGDMSIVGPRPPLPSEVQKYERWQRRRLSMRPGLTCIWQVSDRNQATFDKWMEYDLQYIDHWSLFLDVEILLYTIPAVFKGTGI